MRRLAMLATIGLGLVSAPGCMLNIWHPDPVERTNQMLVVSEDMRMIYDEWKRIWFTDQPQHTTPYRTHGGML